MNCLWAKDQGVLRFIYIPLFTKDESLVGRLFFWGGLF
jgi:hypothetical protein